MIYPFEKNVARPEASLACCFTSFLLSALAQLNPGVAVCSLIAAKHGRAGKSNAGERPYFAPDIRYPRVCDFVGHTQQGVSMTVLAGGLQR